jgi:acetyl esterase/lipase
MGFSAGGHLASTIATHFHKSYIDNTEGISLRPSFQILGYPVISFMDSLAHMGSRNNLIGEHPSAEMIRGFSNELNVTEDSPPAFIVHASDDKTVKVENSIEYYEALVKKHVLAEIHIYQKGGHGFGIHNKTTTDEWMERLHNWMRANKWTL